MYESCSDHTNDHARQLILVRLFKFELNIPNYQAIEYDLFCQHLPPLRHVNVFSGKV